MPAKTKKARREAALKAWRTRRKKAKIRHEAAIKAWVTRRKNERARKRRRSAA